MALILNINAALEKAEVALSDNGIIIAEAENNYQKEHASFLEPAIKKIISDSGLTLQRVDAVCVVNGPGSYTGLRVALSSAKAICYALQKPLILLNTLDVMAHALKTQSPVYNQNVLFCPLIDARRMEVYTALYNARLELIKPYEDVILQEDFLSTEIKTNTIIAGGSGSAKLQNLINHNIHFIQPLYLSPAIAGMAEQAFNAKIFSNVAYSEPFYLKPFYTVKPV